jgi:hypothetical protein
MANRKITDLTALTAPAAGDVLPIVDISEVTAADKNKKITIQNLFQGIPVSVGIGTSSPEYRLDVQGGNARIYAGGGGSALEIGSGATGNQYAFLDLVGDTTYSDYGLRLIRNNSGANTSSVLTHRGTGDLNIMAEDAGSVIIATQSAERFRVASNGNVGIGTSSPTAPLSVQASASSYTTSFLNVGDPSLSTGKQLYFGYHNTDNNAYIQSVHWGTVFTPLVLNPNGGNVGIGIGSPSYRLQLATDSAGKPSTNTWTVVSDERIKEDIELADLDMCYEAVKNIPLKRYKWKDDVYTEEQVADRHKIGWIAQDVEAVFPKAVGTHEFKYNQVFEDGELVSEDVIEDCRDLNADQLYAAMYGTIQKLIAKIEALEAQVAQG